MGQAAEGHAESRRRYMTTWLIYIRTAAAVFGMSNTAADGVGRPNKLESSLSTLLSFRPRGIYRCKYVQSHRVVTTVTLSPDDGHSHLGGFIWKL